MAEVGVVHVARVCRTIAERAMPRDRSQCSKPVFTPPQRLTILCLMRYEDWTFREAAGRLAEHAALRRVVALVNVPDHTTLCRFLRCLAPSLTQPVRAGPCGAFPRNRAQR